MWNDAPDGARRTGGSGRPRAPTFVAALGPARAGAAALVAALGPARAGAAALVAALSLVAGAGCGDDDASASAGAAGSPSSAGSSPSGGAGGAAGESGAAGAGGAEAGAGGAGFVWALPPGFPVPSVPDDNPMSAAKIELGRHLFYDQRLSGNLTQSCASCHRQELAFTDGVARPKGSTGEEHPRSAMSLANVAYAPSLTWANPNLATLEKQTLVPMFGERPVELGLAGREGELLERLRAEPLYPSLFEQAFPGEAEPIRLDAVIKAISAFERSLISGDAPYDRFTQKGDLTAVSTSALRGRELFFSEKLECFHCHGNFLFADAAKHTGTKIIEMLFHNTGLYNVDGAGAYPPGGEGLFEITGAPADMGRFKAPSLRNVAVTAPYMHDGSIASLDEAIDHYAAAGRTLAAGAYPGVGSLNPFKSEFIVGFTLDPTERADLKAFLESLTDQGFLTNPAFADPWPPAPPLASPALGATFGP